jgi:hypothetical protein
LALFALPASAVPYVTVSQGVEADLDGGVAVGDLVAGMDPPATVFPDDMGWHFVNTNPQDQWSAFVDDTYYLAGHPYYGLLNDNQPNLSGRFVKHFEYDLGQVEDITEVRVISGNKDINGRVFHTYTVQFSADGVNYTPEIYVQSHASGTINLPAGPNMWEAAETRLRDDAGILAQAQFVQFRMFSASNTQGMSVDPYDGINPFTGVDDGNVPAGESPLIWEVDILPEPGTLGLLLLGGIAVLRRR